MLEFAPVAKLLWTQKQDLGPSPRAAHAMAFDTANKAVLLFGGTAAGNQTLGDTWSWDGEDWTQLEDIGPPARAQHTMAYDSARQRTVLFGGVSQDGEFGDTWEWDGSSWTQIQDTGPRPRLSHAMTFDSVRNRVVLFGGTHVNTNVENDTWEWDGSDWSQVEDSGPAARAGHSMAFDSVRSRTVLFGGAAGQTVFGDTWEWDGNLWKQVQDMGPSPATEGSMVFRSQTSALFGGISATSKVQGRKMFGLTWEWNGSHWTARQDIGVGARYEHAMAFDGVRGRVVVFGGRGIAADEQNADAGLRGDTWEHVDAPANPPGTGVPVTSITAAPNPVKEGQVLVLTVQLQMAAPQGGENVDIAGDFGNIGTVTVAQGSTTASYSLPIPSNAGITQPITGNITATGGGVTKSVSVTIQP